MKILTLGASPYLLVRDAKIHADIIRSFVDKNVGVSSVVWNHDTSYFAPDADGKLRYEATQDTKVDLYAIDYRLQTASIQVYDAMKEVQPDVIISIGSHEETSFLAAIKMMYPNLFKWIAIHTNETSGLLYNNKEAFEFVDFLVTTSEFAYKETAKVANIHGQFLSYGPNHNDFYCTDDTIRSGFLYSARNTLASNLPAYIMSVANCGMRAHLHTNLYDVGDYSVDDLMRKYEATNMTYTTDYCSVRDGISVDAMRKMYNSYNFYLDCGIKSATALSMLEAMSCGCVPIGPSYGRVGEILAKMPEDFRIVIPYNIYVGSNNEEFAIVDINKVKEIIGSIDMDPACIEAARKASIAVASEYSNRAFMDKLNTIVNDTKNMKQQLAVEIL
jgi:hypothetical protein